MDQRLQTLERAVRADPGDLALARRYRAALLRLAGSGSPEAVAPLDWLEGVCISPRVGWVGSDEKRSPAEWCRAAQDGAAPPLAPRLPGAGLEERWRARGVLLHASTDLVLLERPDRGLEARRAASGEVLWHVPSARPDPDLLTEDERASGLPWAVAPWGAVELGAHYDVPLQYRRVGRHHPELGRVTHREPVGRALVGIEVALQVVLPGGGRWSAAAPSVLAERAEPGQPLCEGDLLLEAEEDDLLELSLDAASSTFAVWWRDEGQDPAIYAIEEAACMPRSVIPAGWTVGGDERPFPHAPLLGLACPGPPGTVYRVRGARLVHEDELAGRELASFHVGEGAEVLGGDEAALVLAPGSAPLLLPWTEAPRPWPGGPALLRVLDGRWPAVSPVPRLPLEDQGWLLCQGGRLHVQLGTDEVVVLTEGEAA